MIVRVIGGQHKATDYYRIEGNLAIPVTDKAPAPQRCRWCGAFLVNGKCPVDRKECNKSKKVLQSNF